MHARFGLEAEIAAVEARLLRAVAAREPLLQELAEYVIGAGGKRIRPLAALLAFRAAGGRDEDLDPVIDIATGLELIHTATLMHDDINDGAKTRRGRDSAHRRYGPALALIGGDFLFTQGFQISGRFDRTIVDWTADACRSLAEGEFLQARFLNDPSIEIEDYLTLVERKTACFIATGIRIGAYLAGADQKTVDGLYRYGVNLGIAFQIVDDVLDVAGDAGRTGKRIGIDIRDGNPTLPSILTVRGSTEGSGRLVQILKTPERGDDDVSAALQIIRESGALDEARALAAEYGARARKEAEVVTDDFRRTQLLDLVDLVVDRDL